MADALFVTRQSLALLLVGFLSCYSVGTALAGTTRVVAVSGDVVPEGGRDFIWLWEPSLSDAGQMAFIGDFKSQADGTVGSGLYLFGPRGVESSLIAQEGLDLPSGGELSRVLNPTHFGFHAFSIPNISQPHIHPNGDVFFEGLIREEVDQRSKFTTGFFRSSEAGGFELIYRPDLSWVNTYRTNGFDYPVNSAGQLVFTGQYIDAGSRSTDGIFRVDQDGTLKSVVLANQPGPTEMLVPRISLHAGVRAYPALNDAGQIAFRAVEEGVGVGMYRVNEYSQGLVKIAGQGQPAPGGEGIFYDVTPFPALNNNGQVAFWGGIRRQNPPPQFSHTLTGIFLGDGDSVLSLAQSGQESYDGDGVFSRRGFSYVPALNEAGQIAFMGDVDTSLSTDARTGYSGVYLGEASGLTQIARTGDLVPDGNGRFSGFSPHWSSRNDVFYHEALALNEGGQVLFHGTLVDTLAGEASGLFLGDKNSGVVEIARSGDELLGSTIEELNFSPSNGSRGNGRSGLNNLGQVAYRFALADGRTGIAIWTIPEPGALVLLAIMLATLAFHGDRSRRANV